MNGYELSKQWFDWCFENPDKINPNHTALYFFAIEHCNRLGWKEKFGLPTQMSMDAIGVKNWRTFSKAFNDLVEWGFIKIITKSRNQYSATVIAIVKNTEANTQALTKAMQKHVQKQSKSIAVINKPINQELINQELIINTPEFFPFDEFWNLYDKKRGDIEKLKKQWSKISKSEREKIKTYLPEYIKSTPDKQFRKDPSTFINQKAWNDEITTYQKSKINGNKSTEPTDFSDKSRYDKSAN